MARDTGGNVKVDFVWGNFPMQPDDDRQTSPTQTVTAGGDQNVSWTNYGTKASAKLDTTLANHSVALNNWNGYPDYTPEAPFLDTVDQAAVPTVTGLTETAAGTALVAAGFVKGTVTTTAEGATEVNDGLVKTQSIAAATLTNVGTAVNLVKYAYVAP